MNTDGGTANAIRAYQGLAEQTTADSARRNAAIQGIGSNIDSGIEAYGAEQKKKAAGDALEKHLVGDLGMDPAAAHALRATENPQMIHDGAMQALARKRNRAAAAMMGFGGGAPAAGGAPQSAGPGAAPAAGGDSGGAMIPFSGGGVGGAAPPTAPAAPSSGGGASAFDPGDVDAELMMKFQDVQANRARQAKIDSYNQGGFKSAYDQSQSAIDKANATEDAQSKGVSKAASALLAPVTPDPIGDSLTGQDDPGSLNFKQNTSQAVPDEATIATRVSQAKPSPYVPKGAALAKSLLPPAAKPVDASLTAERTARAGLDDAKKGQVGQPKPGEEPLTAEEATKLGYPDLEGTKRSIALDAAHSRNAKSQQTTSLAQQQKRLDFAIAEAAKKPKALDPALVERLKNARAALAGDSRALNSSATEQVQTDLAKADALLGTAGAPAAGGGEGNPDATPTTEEQGKIDGDAEVSASWKAWTPLQRAEFLGHSRKPK